jgi:hypothetical protein
MSEAVPSARQGPKPYWNPYVAGVGLGLTLLAAFVIIGRGLGASGGFTTAVSYGVQVVSWVCLSGDWHQGCWPVECDQRYSVARASLRTGDWHLPWRADC